jgi:hypothetical protein
LVTRKEIVNSVVSPFARVKEVVDADFRASDQVVVAPLPFRSTPGKPFRVQMWPLLFRRATAVDVWSPEVVEGTASPPVAKEMARSAV